MKRHNFLSTLLISPIKLITTGIYHLFKMAGAVIFTAAVILCIVNIFLGHYELCLIFFLIALILFLAASAIANLK